MFVEIDTWGVARNRRLAQRYRLERVAGYGIIGAQRSNSVPIFIDRGAPFRYTLSAPNAADLAPLDGGRTAERTSLLRTSTPAALERFFGTGDGRRLSVRNTRRIANILCALDDASRPEDMNLPGFRFHALTGRNKGRYAVNVSGNWRITFGWTEGDATDVDPEDYH
jgi:toxin HigB-1